MRAFPDSTAGRPPNAPPGRRAWRLGPVLALLLSGCAGYQLGPTMGREAGATSVQVNPFVNHTIEPRLSDAVTQAVRTRFQQDGTFRLDTRDTGDIVVTGHIIEYHRHGVSFDPDDVITPRDFQLTLVVEVIALDRGTGRELLHRRISGRSTARLLADLPNTERQALPLVADDVARRAVALLVDGDW